MINGTNMSKVVTTDNWQQPEVETAPTGTKEVSTNIRTGQADKTIQVIPELPPVDKTAPTGTTSTTTLAQGIKPQENADNPKVINPKDIPQTDIVKGLENPEQERIPQITNEETLQAIEYVSIPEEISDEAINKIMENMAQNPPIGDIIDGHGSNKTYKFSKEFSKSCRVFITEVHSSLAKLSKPDVTNVKDMYELVRNCFTAYKPLERLMIIGFSAAKKEAAAAEQIELKNMLIYSLLNGMDSDQRATLLKVLNSKELISLVSNLNNLNKSLPQNQRVELKNDFCWDGVNFNSSQLALFFSSFSQTIKQYMIDKKELSDEFAMRLDEIERKSQKKVYHEYDTAMVEITKDRLKEGNASIEADFKKILDNLNDPNKLNINLLQGFTHISELTFHNPREIFKEFIQYAQTKDPGFSTEIIADFINNLENNGYNVEENEILFNIKFILAQPERGKILLDIIRDPQFATVAFSQTIHDTLNQAQQLGIPESEIKNWFFDLLKDENFSSELISNIYHTIQDTKLGIAFLKNLYDLNVDNLQMRDFIDSLGQSNALQPATISQWRNFFRAVKNFFYKIITIGFGTTTSLTDDYFAQQAKDFAQASGQQYSELINTENIKAPLIKIFAEIIANPATDQDNLKYTAPDFEHSQKYAQIFYENLLKNL